MSSKREETEKCPIDPDIFPMPVSVWEKVAADMGLSRRHKEIVERLLHSRQTKQIAMDLNSRVATIETHLKRIYRYHGVCGRNELTMLIFRLAMKTNVAVIGDTEASDT